MHPMQPRALTGLFFCVKPTWLSKKSAGSCLFGLPQQGGQQCPELAGLQPDGGRSQEEQGEKYYGNAR